MSDRLVECAAICIGCGDVVTTDQVYFELGCRRLDDPSVEVTLVCHVWCKASCVRDARSRDWQAWLGTWLHQNDVGRT